MCGIFGIVNLTSIEAPSLGKLKTSLDLLHHRGPDASGTYSSNGFGFAHARLSLLDLDPRSNQPFWEESGRYCLIYNGEIYNFKEIRAELEQKGVNFITSGDTEVLIKGLIYLGSEELLPRLEGMFAFSFYDKKNDTMILARDRFGMKPLYVYEDNQHFIFSSEIKAIRPWIEFNVDQFSISSYLLGFGGPTKGATFYRGVRSIEPGSIIKFCKGKETSYGHFFKISDFLDSGAIDELSSFSPKKIVDMADELLFESVNKHMFADAKVGAFCSGGVDSSLLMAMANKQHKDLAIFHANVKGQWSEHHAAVSLSKHLGLELCTIDIEEQDFVDMLPKVMFHYEHPYTHNPNSAALMMVAQLAKDQGVTGLLSGEGSDECFLGYPWLGRKRLEDWYHAMGRNLRSVVHKIPELGVILWPSEGNSTEIARSIFNRCEISDDEQRNREVYKSIASSKTSVHTVTTLDYLNYQLRTLLHRNDSMGMAASIEARFPILDHKLVKMAVNLPAEYKLRFSPKVLVKAHPFIRDKWVIRKVADRYVPRDLSQRIKQGFWTTVFQRMQISEQYFKQSFVSNMLGLTDIQMNSILDKSDQDMKMRLLHLNIWGLTCIENETIEDITTQLRDATNISPE